MDAKQYSDTFTAVQSALNKYQTNSWVGIIGDNPLSQHDLTKSIQRVLGNMQEQGLNSSPTLFLGAHSPAQSFLMQDAAVNTTLPAHASLGLILFGGFLNRYTRPFSACPVLTLGGDVDGVARITRVGAEEYYHQQMRIQSSTKVQNNPVVILQGLSHMSFATGTPSTYIKSLDFKAEVTEETAHNSISEVVGAFVAYHVNH